MRENLSCVNGPGSNSIGLIECHNEVCMTWYLLCEKSSKKCCTIPLVALYFSCDKNYQSLIISGLITYFYIFLYFCD